MTTDRWLLLRQRFEQAADADPAARAALIEAWRRDDPALAAEVERLLEVDEEVAVGAPLTLSSSLEPCRSLIPCRFPTG